MKVTRNERWIAAEILREKFGPLSVGEGAEDPIIVVSKSDRILAKVYEDGSYRTSGMAVGVRDGPYFVGSILGGIVAFEIERYQ